MFRKGVVLTNNIDIIKYASFKYKAMIKLLSHPSNVRDNFSPVIHSGTIRQCAKITILSKEISKNKIENAGSIGGSNLLTEDYEYMLDLCEYIKKTNHSLFEYPDDIVWNWIW